MLYTMTASRVRSYTGLIALASAAALFISFRLHPPSFNSQWWVVFATFLVLFLASELLAVTISEHGSFTTMDYVPQLGAVLLIGPAGAGLLSLISWSTFQVFFTDKAPIKRVFNISQITLSVCASGLCYIALGGTPSLDQFNILGSLLPFVGAVIVYFGLNRLSVASAITLAERRPPREVLQTLSLTPVSFDLIGSSLALLVAFLYVEWGSVALIATLVPIIGLRYSYGVSLQLRQLTSDLLRVLIKTIEAQDPYTSGHSVRVAEGAITIGRHLGLNSKHLNNLETAALLHDIGKIDSAYREILTQDAPLNDEQAQLIKEHPERGVELIKSVRQLDPDVLKYIRHHHERFDGEGYPDGLEGDEIPLGARIIMVADAIDAMVTSRAYRDALSSEKAGRELRDNKGSQFDPRVVEAALETELIKKLTDSVGEESEHFTSS